MSVKAAEKRLSSLIHKLDEKRRELKGHGFIGLPAAKRPVPSMGGRRRVGRPRKMAGGMTDYYGSALSTGGRRRVGRSRKHVGGMTDYYGSALSRGAGLTVYGSGLSTYGAALSTGGRKRGRPRKHIVGGNATHAVVSSGPSQAFYERLVSGFPTYSQPSYPCPIWKGGSSGGCGGEGGRRPIRKYKRGGINTGGANKVLAEWRHHLERVRMDHPNLTFLQARKLAQKMWHGHR